MKTELVNPYELILEKSDADRVEAVVIGSATMQMLEIIGEKPIVAIPATKLGVPLTLEEARPFLNYQVEVYEPHGASPVVA